MTRSRARARSNSSELEKLWELVENGKPGMLACRETRIRELLLSPEHNVRVQVERLLMEQQFGKPRQQVEHSGNMTTRYVLETPHEMTRAQWLAQHVASQKALAEHEGVVN
jgi:hypothetical protein